MEPPCLSFLFLLTPSHLYHFSAPASSLPLPTSPSSQHSVDAMGCFNIGLHVIPLYQLLDVSESPATPSVLGHSPVVGWEGGGFERLFIDAPASLRTLLALYDGISERNFSE
eukprot:RCo053860